MLVAKCLKIFSRTGTQPSPLTYHVGDETHGSQFQESASNLQPTGVAATSRYVISRIPIYLAAKVIGIPLLARVTGIWQSSALVHFRERFSASNSPTAEGEGNNQKIHLLGIRSPARVFRW